MPNVPNVPGIPPLSAYGPNDVLLLATSLLTLFFGTGQPVWGIYLDGSPAIDYNSTVSFEFGKDYVISDYPVENGSFESYDKVEEPFDIRMSIVSGGSSADRQDLIAQVAAAADSMDLYDVVTPNAVFTSCSIRHADFRQRADSGLGMLVIHLYLVQIRESAQTQFTSTAQPGDSAQVGRGNVQVTAVGEQAGVNFATRFNDLGGAR